MIREMTLFASAARTADATSEEQSDDGIAVDVLIEVSAITATPSVVPIIQARNPATGAWYAVLTGAAIVATTTAPIVLSVGPELTPVANVAVSKRLPKSWRLFMDHADTDSITYSAGAVVYDD